MGAQATDLTGNIYGRLTVISRAPSRKIFVESLGRFKKKTYWNCLCECGNGIEIWAGSLGNGNTISCGCFRKETTSKNFYKHGSKNNPEYWSWSNMVQRCTNQRSPNYPYYGKRGISVCPQWLNSFGQFLEDMGKKPTKNHTLERINNNGNYEPENCKWATRKEQSKNRRGFHPARISTNNTSGIMGVRFDKLRNKWKCEFTFNRQTIIKKRFKTLLDAAAARKSAENKYWSN